MVKKHKPVYNPYRDMIEELNKEKVDYVLIGMAGINFYARSAADSFVTYDHDLFLRPTIRNVGKALAVFRKCGYKTLTVDGAISERNLADALRLKKTIIAANQDGIVFEILSAVSGFVFHQMADDASIFSDDGVLVRVGKLQKLLASKKAAGRQKDLQFLKRYEMLLKERQTEASGPTGR